MLSTSRYKIQVWHTVTPADCMWTRVMTYLAEHQEEHSIGHTEGIFRLSVVHRHPWQLREKSSPFILWQWGGTGSEGEGWLVFQAVQFEGFFHQMSYHAAERSLPELHLTGDQVRAVVSFSSSALTSRSWNSTALLFSPLLMGRCQVEEGSQMMSRWGGKWFHVYNSISPLFALQTPVDSTKDFSLLSHIRVLYTSTIKYILYHTVSFLKN